MNITLENTLAGQTIPNIADELALFSQQELCEFKQRIQQIEHACHIQLQFDFDRTKKNPTATNATPSNALLNLGSSSSFFFRTTNKAALPDVAHSNPSIKKSSTYQVYAGTLYDVKMLHNNPDNSDVCFIVEGKKFYGHARIISAVMPALKERIDHAMQNDQTSIVIEGISASTLETVLSYIYNDELLTDEKNIIEVLHMAYHFEIEGIMDQALKQVSSKVLQKNSKLMPQQLFRIVARWIAVQMPPLSHEEIEKVLQYTRYETMSTQQLFAIVEPTKLVSTQRIIELCKRNARQNSTAL